MGNQFFDFEDGDFCYSLSDDMAMDSDGNMMIRIGDTIAMDMDSGDLHMISSWDRDGDNDRSSVSGSYRWDDEDE